MKMISMNRYFRFCLYYPLLLSFCSIFMLLLFDSIQKTGGTGEFVKNMNYLHYYIINILLAGGVMFFAFMPVFLLSEARVYEKVLYRWLCWWGLFVPVYAGLLALYIALISYPAYFLLWPYPVGAVIGWILFNKHRKIGDRSV